MDTSATVSGGFKGFSASASAAYGEVNNLVTSSQDDRHTEKGTMTTYNPLDYQIQREVKTSIQIDGKTALYVEKRYVDSTSRGEKWTRPQLQAASENYLRNRFHGEDDKISGSTYKMETCVKETCKGKCKQCKTLCNICSANSKFGYSFPASLCAHKCSLAYAGNGLRRKFTQEEYARHMIGDMCDVLLNKAIGKPRFDSEYYSNFIEMMQNWEHSIN